MAKLYITEYASQGMDYSRGMPVPSGGEPPVTTQVVTIGGVSTQSNPFNAATQLVRVHTDAVCSLLFGLNPVADANSPRLSKDGTEYFVVHPGAGMKLAVISNV